MLTNPGRSAVGFALGVVLVLAALGGRQVSSREGSPRDLADRALATAGPPSPERLAALERARIEADANCAAAAELESGLVGSRRVLLATSALEQVTAIDWSPHLSAREQQALVAASRFLKDLARGLEGRAALARSVLEGARLTPEDARFLLAAVHGRLDRLQRRAQVQDPRWEHASALGALDPRKLLQFRDMTFERGLDSWEP